MELALRYPKLSHPKWTPQQTDKLKELWAAGLSCSEIAREIGCFTRNAIIGKVHRLELPARPRRVNQFGYARKPQTPRAPRKYKQTYIAKERPPAPEIIDNLIPFEQRKSLLELGLRDCRFVVGDPNEGHYFFCGGLAAEGRSYCDGHHARVHR